MIKYNMFFNKNNSHAGFLGKGFGGKLIGAGKAAASFLDNNMVNAGVAALSPELALALGAVRKTGILEKLKQ